VHSLLKTPEQLRPCLHVDALRSSSPRGRLRRRIDEQLQDQNCVRGHIRIPSS
jgi:hypothetical protein